MTFGTRIKKMWANLYKLDKGKDKKWSDRQMNREKILEKIKDLNSLRARQNRDFKETQEKYNHHEMTDKEFKKHEKNFHKNHEKLRHEIQELEHKLNEL